MSKAVDAKYQTQLQRKIFTRWINQKLIPQKVAPIGDCVDDFKDGYNLTKLLEVLSEKESGIKNLGPQTSRMKQIDQASRALKFTESCGVEQKLKTSAENLVDSHESSILALVWAIMLKFLKFSDDEDEEKLSAEDALLMWVQNQVPSEVEVVNFKKSFANGMALAAIMAKYRPKLLDLSSCSPGDAENNLKKVFACAEKCFGLEQYLTTQDFASLDPKSMMVYVADYYLGAAQMRKIDLGVRRITKLIDYTRTNDKMKQDFVEIAGPLRKRVDAALSALQTHIIDDTMAGARQNMSEFNSYKANEKGKNVSDFLKCENLYNALSLRLKDHSHPAYLPGDGLLPSDLASTFASIEVEEKKKSKALSEELNRQIKLANLYEQHKARTGKLANWTAEKLTYLNTKENVGTSGQAKFHLNVLKSYVSEAANIKAQSWDAVQKVGSELVKERFEHSAAVQSAEAGIASSLVDMDAAQAKKQAVLDDDLARELYKESVNLVADAHASRFCDLEAWINAKLAYTTKKEEVLSVSEAQLQLALLAAYENNKADLAKTSLPNLEALAQQILASEYKTDLSSWEYPDKAAITTKQTFVSDSWAQLSSNSAQKLLVLEDDLAREKYKEEIRLCNMEHVSSHQSLQAWIEVKEAYLAVREEIDTVDKAQVALQALEAYVNDNNDQTKTTVPGFKALGQKIITAEYKTDLSQWVSPDVPAVNEREKYVDDKWVALAQACTEKKSFLDAELARELKKEEFRLQIAGLASDFMVWSSNHLEDVKASHFGFLLEEVEAYGAVLVASDAEITNDGTSKLSTYNAVNADAAAIGVKDNRYTNIVPGDLDSSLEKLKSACTERKAAYDTELARQRANDALDREFSELVEGLTKQIDGYRHEITESKAELADQASFVDARIADTAQSGLLPKVKELNSKIEAADFAVRHTTISALDVDITWQNYSSFLSSKKDALASEIQHKELRGVSLSDYEDIENQFKQFDKNGSNDLDSNELKACLYSLGEEVSKKRVNEIIQSYGKPFNAPEGKVNYEGFKEFMISQLGDTDTADEILAAFEVVNGGAEVAKIDVMLELLADADVDWFKKEAPPEGADYNYKAFTEQVFAR
mmetsp:Transcript_33112/g.64953  ORF Transcript_33112/g.64953 Transcript_33112/m.64953 type:complete len:1106 (+) Transcript_33112:33-3350(+)